MTNDTQTALPVYIFNQYGELKKIIDLSLVALDDKIIKFMAETLPDAEPLSLDEWLYENHDKLTDAQRVKGQELVDEYLDFH